MWSAMNTLLAEAVPGNRYVRVFSFNNAIASIGIGIGAAIGGLFLGGTSPQAYEIMFLIDAVTFGIFAIVLSVTGEVSRSKGFQGTGEPGPADEERASTGTGWLAVLSDRRLVLITALNALLVTVMFSQLTVAFPAWSVGPAHSSAGVVGAAFAVNAVLVAGLQSVLIGRIELMTRTTAAAAAALLFACCWLVALAAPYGHGGLLTAVALVAALVLAALGEILLAPSLSALVNGLATDTLRGRYNALFNLAWQVGPIVGPAIAGLLIGNGMSRLLLVGLSAACVLAAGYAWALQAILPPAVNGAR
jgi:MFS family permease